MPHELAETSGKKAMVYVGETPWHGLGTRLDNPATAEEAIDAADLNYDVALTPMTTIDGQPIPDRRAVVRSDSSSVLGVVGKSYQPVQNRQCFGFLDAVVGDGRLRYHTAGALGQGERVWMLAKLPDEIRVKDSDDVTEQFLLLSNSHDGSSSLRVFFHPNSRRLREHARDGRTAIRQEGRFDRPQGRPCGQGGRGSGGSGFGEAVLRRSR
ncbi:MAG TPA: DUF932 domain-containing protein [Planctomycetaceae bacterium]|jgi:phage/plasmid-like protein (TIGR03299 family)|nr:DUF932 domain-containing protein [Planctomycetaceae bacterium]